MSERVELTVNSRDCVIATIERAAGTVYYPALIDKPSIEGHVLVDDSSLGEIGISDITEQDIDRIIVG